MLSWIHSFHIIVRGGFLFTYFIWISWNQIKFNEICIKLCFMKVSDKYFTGSSLFYKTSVSHECHECHTSNASAIRVQHEQHKCDTSGTRITQVWHQCYTTNMRATRVRNECYTNDTSATWLKNLNFDSEAFENIFYTTILAIWLMKDYKETNNFILRTTFWKCIVPMRKSVWKLHPKTKLYNRKSYIKNLYTVL